MADLSTFTNMPHENISAYGDLIKTIASLNPVVGGIITAIAAYFINKNTKVTKVNTSVTETNTAAKGLTPEVLISHKDEIQVIKDEAVKEFREITEGLKSHMTEELNKTKIVFMKVSKEAQAKLAMTPKIDQAIEERIHRLEKVSAEIVHELQGGKKK